MHVSVKPTLGIALLLAGAAILLLGLPDLPFFWHKPYTQQAELKLGDADFPKLESHYPLDKLTRYAISAKGSSPLTLQVADYRDAQGHTRRATLHLPVVTDAAVPTPAAAGQQLRYNIWTDAAKSITSHSGPHSLFLTWWDNGQRLNLLTGIDAWTLLPDAKAWRDDHERRFWQTVAGGSDDGQKLRQLARWLTMDAAQAVKEMAEQLPKDRDAYWLVGADDLARLGEIETLAGVTLPLETRLFPTGDNFHALIAQVKRWAQEQGDGNYLVQQLPGYGVRAWRVADAKANDLLITRLLPFTGSLNRLPDGLQLVYQSEQAYLSVYRLNNAAAVLH